jgi:NAD(P) transhydrogenase subunit alpha
VGPINIPSQLSSHASLLYAKNMMALLKLLIKEGELVFDLDDEIILNTTITKDGEIISPLLQTN